MKKPIDGPFAAMVNKMSRKRAEKLMGGYNDEVQAHFEKADLVLAEWPLDGELRDRMPLKGVELLKRVSSSGVAEETSIVIFPVDSIEQAAAMSRIYGNGSLE
jgi:hypothetical protein